MLSTIQDRAKALGFNTGLVDHKTDELTQFCGLEINGYDQSIEVFYPRDLEYPVTFETDMIICKYFVQLAHK